MSLEGDSQSVERVSRALDACSGLSLVVTGAGVSLASGIPTFRGTDSGAVWKNDVMEKGTYRYFRSHTAESWQWYASRFDSLRHAQPNPAHFAIAELEKLFAEHGREFLLITQNVDGLHRLAGSRDFVEVHGCSRFVRCATVGCAVGAPVGKIPREEVAAAIDAFLADPKQESLPLCSLCGDVLRPHVLWFDEFYNEHDDYQWERTQDAAARAEVVLFVGTSFSVGVTDLIAQHAAMRSVPTFSVDPGAALPPYRNIEVVPVEAESLLPGIVSRLATRG